MVLYDVDINEEAPQVAISEAVSDGVNDSLEYVWMEIKNHRRECIAISLEG